MRIKMVILMFLLVGCTNVQVYDNPKSQSTNSQINGIPFYIKVPQLVQDTKYYEEFLWVSFTIEATEGSKKVTNVLTSTPIILPATKDIDALIANSISKFKAKDKEMWSMDEAIRQANELIVNPLLEKQSLKVNDPKPLSNTWSVEMVVSPKPYYITARTPLFGSATSNYEFSNDGTLTKAESTITDETAKTLLGLFPIAKKLEVRWGAVADPNKPPPTAESLAAKKQRENAVQYAVVATIKSVKRVTVLKKKEFIAADAKFDELMTNRCKLSFADGLNGTNGVQLISQEFVTENQSPEDKPKPNKKAYKLEGTFTPPE